MILKPTLAQGMFDIRVGGDVYQIKKSDLQKAGDVATVITTVNAWLQPKGYRIAVDFTYKVLWLGPISELPWGGAPGYTPPA